MWPESDVGALLTCCPHFPGIEFHSDWDWSVALVDCHSRGARGLLEVTIALLLSDWVHTLITLLTVNKTHTRAVNCQGPHNTILSCCLGTDTKCIVILTILCVLRFNVPNILLTMFTHGFDPSCKQKRCKQIGSLFKKKMENKLHVWKKFCCRYSQLVQK